MNRILLALLAGFLCSAAWAETSEPLIAAPDFDLPAIANAEGQLQLTGFSGDVVYLDFWASWCGPCRLSLPALNTLWRDLDRDDFKVVAISIDAVEEDALDFLDNYPVSYPVLIDTESRVPSEFAVNGMPSGYLIDRAGFVREVHVGFQRGDEQKIRASVEALLAE